MDEFARRLRENLVAEALSHLPRNTKFHAYYGNRFWFVQRQDNGETFLHTMRTTPLEAIRFGMESATAVVQKIVASPSSDEEVKWVPDFGLFGAPDGMYLSFTNRSEHQGPRTSYGQVRDGQYHQVLGTNWSCYPGSYSLWDHKPANVLIKNSRLFLGPKPEATLSHQAFWMDSDKIGPRMDHSEVANRINEHLHRDRWWRDPYPSPEYYDKSRWSYDADENTWTFT